MSKQKTVFYFVTQETQVANGTLLIAVRNTKSSAKGGLPVTIRQDHAVPSIRTLVFG